MPEPDLSRFDRDPEALAWARARVEHSLNWIDQMIQQGTERGNEEGVALFRFARNVISREFVGGEGCVIAAFDKRRPDLPRQDGVAW